MIKYQLPYKSYDDSDWLLTIDIPNYSGSPITVSGVDGRSAILNYEGGIDDQWDNPLVNVTLISELYNEGQIDVSELQLVEDRQCIVTLTRNSVVKFKGYLIADGMQYELNNLPSTVQITATSGLNLLDGITYIGFGGELGIRSPLNFFRRILQNSNLLGIQLPIRWTPTLSQVATSISDAFESAIWSNNGQGFYTYNVKTNTYTYADCKYILEGLTKALQCRIVQADGAWWVLGLKQSLSDVISYKECANYTGTPVITTHTRSSNKAIGTDYISIQNDSVMTVIPAIKTINAAYNQKQRQNIIPNGGQDELVLGFPLFWSAESGLSASSDVDITGQGGSSIKLWNPNTTDRKYYLTGALPIDANILYKRITWGFTFMPVSGYSVDSSGFINWLNSEMKVSIKYTVNQGGYIKDFYLNEFGFWSDGSITSGLIVDQGYDSASSRYYVDFDNTRNFDVGDRYSIIFYYLSGTESKEYTFTTKPASFTAGIISIITNTGSTGSTDIGNITRIFYPISKPFFYIIASLNKADNYYKYIYFKQDQLKLNDAVAFTYRGASNFDMFIIDPGNLGASSSTGPGRLSIEFYVRGNKTCILDYIWMQIDDNQDLYVVTNNSTTNSTKKDIDLNISSSFSGFFESNFMRSYNTSDEDWKFNDGINTGSLTELYARAVMRSRYKPSFIFNGTISTRGKDWSFIDNYTISGFSGKKFIPLNPSYNTSRNEVSLIAIEDRSDNISMNVLHKGKNEDNN